jgi:Ubiquitin-activating enzyme E1 four-helix bundle
VTPYAFKIGSIKKFTKYERNGIARQLKTKKIMAFKPAEEIFKASAQDIPLDGNLAVADFEKMQNNVLAHLAFETLDQFKHKNAGRAPEPWNFKDTSDFVKIAKELAASPKYSEAGMKPVAEWETGDDTGSYEYRFLSLFSLTCSGVFNPLCAFQGGVVA